MARCLQGVCTEAGMYALRERRVHVTQEDFEMAVTKVMKKDSESSQPSCVSQLSIHKLLPPRRRRPCRLRPLAILKTNLPRR